MHISARVHVFMHVWGLCACVFSTLGVGCATQVKNLTEQEACTSSLLLRSMEPWALPLSRQLPCGGFVISGA